MTIRLIVVDRSPITLLGMRKFAEGTEIEIVAELTSCGDLCRLVLENRVDVIILSFCMSAQESINQTRSTRHTAPRTGVILVTDNPSPVFLAHARDAGANEVIVGNLSRQRFLDSVRRAADGRSVWSKHDLRRLAAVSKAKYDRTDLDVPLTSREIDVLRCLVRGETNREVADALGISYETVREHVQNLLRKIAVDDRTQAAVWAVRNGMA